MSDLGDRLRPIRLLLLDVDGVLTDGRLDYGPDGDRGRSFDVRDGLGIKIAQRAGLLVGVLSGRDVEATARRASELGLDEIHQGRLKKLPVFEDILARRGLEPAQVAFMGDDLIDLPVLARAGLAAAPSDAREEVRAAAHWIARAPGGRGCVRELIELVLEAQGRWEELVDGYRS